MVDEAAGAIVTQIREAQESAQSGTEATAGPRELRFVLELDEGTTVDNLSQRLAAILPVAFTAERMFPDAEGDLARFFLARIPAIGFEQLRTSPFDLAYLLRDQLNLASCEPDLETEFYNGLESAEIIDCWVEESEEPQDRGWALRAARVPQAWALSQGAGIVIGQPDTGVSKHVELDGPIRPDLGYDFLDDDADPTDPLVKLNAWDQPGHGTGTASVAVSWGTVVAPVAGVESGTGGPGRVTGSAPRATLVPYRAIRTVMRVQQANVAKAIARATRTGCHVITMSLGGLPSLALRAALRDAIRNHVIVLAAAGNCVGLVVYPARYEDCIAVAGTNIRDQPWKGSCSGSAVDISAPGEFVWRAKRVQPSDPTDVVSGGQGTSFAVALTAGVAALWLACHGRDALIASLAPGETLQSRFRAVLQETARRPAGAWDAANYGPGIVDAEALLRADPFASRFAGEAVATAPRSETYGALVTDLVAEAWGAGAAEAAEDTLGLTPAERERFGLEISWLVYKDRQAKRRRTSDAELAEAMMTARKQPSAALRAAAEGRGSSALKALVGGG